MPSMGTQDRLTLRAESRGTPRRIRMVTTVNLPADAVFAGDMDLRPHLQRIATLTGKELDDWKASFRRYGVEPQFRWLGRLVGLRGGRCVNPCRWCS